MARLPQPGGDNGVWGIVLNDFLNVSHNADGTIASNALSAAGSEMVTKKGVPSGYAGLDGAGHVPTANLATGTANSTVFLRGDQTWASAGGGSLSGNTDVNIASPASNQVLSYDTSTSKWINTAALVTSVQGMTGAVTGLALASQLTTLATESQTTSYTLQLGDAGDVVEINSPSNVNLTIPLNSSVNFPVGTILEVCQVGIGQITVVATGGITLNNPGATNKTRTQWSSIALRQRATNNWVLTGDTAAA